MALLDDLDITEPNGDVRAVSALDDYIIEVKALLKAWGNVEHHLGSGAHKFLEGTIAARPPFGNLGRIYFNLDTKTLQRDTGAAWEDKIYYAQRFKVGTFTGDGTSNKAITGLGFPPTYVQVIPSSGTNPAFVKTTAFAVGESHKLTDGTTSTAGIDTLDSDGFTVDADANVNGITYSYLAVRDIP